MNAHKFIPRTPKKNSCIITFLMHQGWMCGDEFFTPLLTQWRRRWNCAICHPISLNLKDCRSHSSSYIPMASSKAPTRHILKNLLKSGVMRATLTFLQNIKHRNFRPLKVVSNQSFYYVMQVLLQINLKIQKKCCSCDWMRTMHYILKQVGCTVHNACKKGE